MDLFVFGTLLHVPLLKVVSGDVDVSRRIIWAARPGYSVSRVEGQVFPVMHADPNGVAEGVIVQGLDDVALARLDYYEQAFDYQRIEFTVFDQNEQPRNVTAYVPPLDRWQPSEPWDREGWIASHGELTTLTALEAMGVMDSKTADQMGRVYPMMMVRAASRLRAEKTPKTNSFGRSDVSVIERTNAYTGFCNLDDVDLKFRRFDGLMSAPVNRTVFVGADCAIVLPYDPVRDRVLLVEQFRVGAYMRGDPNPWTVEPVAGIIDAGEDPEQAARREAEEEAGIILREMRCVSASYPSPGSTTEHFYVYVGITDLPDGSEGLGGKLSEAEDIRSHLMDWADFDRALSAGDFRMMPLIVAGQWLSRNRESLRASA